MSITNGKVYLVLFYMSEANRYLECGRIVNTHGVRGAIKLESWCNTPEDLASLGRIYLCEGEGEYRVLKVRRAKVHGGFVLAEIYGIDSIEQAQLLKGSVVYADREDIELSEGETFIADLIGLPVIDLESGETLGVVTDVLNLGASDLYELDTANGKRLIPAVPEFIKEIDLERGIYVSLIEGMLD